MTRQSHEIASRKFILSPAEVLAMTASMSIVESCSRESTKPRTIMRIPQGSIIGIICLTACFAVCACRHTVKTDMDTYMQDEGSYRGKKVVFITTLSDLVLRQHLYQGRVVELSAPVAFFGKEGFRTWHLMLEKDGKSMRAYEDNYQDQVPLSALNLLLWVTGEKGELAVRGTLKEEGIELSGLAYKEYTVITDVVEERNSYRLNRTSSPDRFRSGYRYLGK